MLRLMVRQLWIPCLVLYLLLDLCTPVVDGFMSFNVDKCVDCTEVERLDSGRPARVDLIQPGPVAMTPSGHAPRLELSQVVVGEATRLPLLIRSAHSSSAGSPDSAEDH